jgi:hypothetical protein
MKSITKAIIALSMIALFSACSDDATEPSPTEPGVLTVQDQMTSQNMIIAKSVTMEKNGWIVVHANNNGSPLTPTIISEPVQVKAGTNKDIMIPLTAAANNLDDNSQVWIMLHTDDGQIGNYEFDGETTLDLPLKNLAGAIIMKPITLTSSKITASDQMVTNSVTVTVNAAADGWIVVHNSNTDGSIVLPGIIGKTKVKAGLNQNIEIKLDEGVSIVSGQKLYPMLHIDREPKGEYNFPGVDLPEVFGFDKEGKGKIIMTTIIAL